MVLVMTLLVLSILILLSYSFSFSAGVSLSAARNAREALRRETRAEAALNYAIALLRGDAEAGEFDALDEDWAETDLSVQVEEFGFAVRIVDENRKLNVNRAALPPEDPEKSFDLREALKRLVRIAGGEETDFQALCAWLDPDTPGFHNGLAPKRPLPMMIGLRAIPDLDAGLFETVEDRPGLDDLLTTHPQNINANTAMKEVLDALWDDATVTARILDRRTKAPFRSTSELRAFLHAILPSDAAQRSASLLAVQSDFFTIRIRPEGEGFGETLTALVRRADKSVQVLNVRLGISEETLP